MREIECSSLMFLDLIMLGCNECYPVKLNQRLHIEDKYQWGYGERGAVKFMRRWPGQSGVVGNPCSAETKSD